PGICGGVGHSENETRHGKELIAKHPLDRPRDDDDGSRKERRMTAKRTTRGAKSGPKKLKAKKETLKDLGTQNTGRVKGGVGLNLTQLCKVTRIFAACQNKTL